MKDRDRLFNAFNRLDETIMQCNHELSSKIGALELQVKQFKYLHIIDNNENLTFSELARILDITKPSVTEIVNKLIKLGCVVKKQSDEDGRVFYIETTEKGKQIARMKRLAKASLTDRVLECLTEEEIDSFTRLVDKITSCEESS